MTLDTKVNHHILQTIIPDTQKEILPLFQKGYVIPIHFNRFLVDKNTMWTLWYCCMILLRYGIKYYM